MATKLHYFESHTRRLHEKSKLSRVTTTILSSIAPVDSREYAICGIYLALRRLVRSLTQTMRLWIGTLSGCSDWEVQKGGNWGDNKESFREHNEWGRHLDFCSQDHRIWRLVSISRWYTFKWWKVKCCLRRSLKFIGTRSCSIRVKLSEDPNPRDYKTIQC